MPWSEANDVIRRREIKKLSNKELSDQIAKIRKRLNSRMRSLERTGYADYSGSYERLINYIRSDLGGYVNKKGNFEFTSRPYSKSSRVAREELLLRWEHKLSYEGLTTEEVKNQLQKEADRLNEKFGKDTEDTPEEEKYNIDKVKRIRDMMKDWRENLDSTISSELFDSQTARKLFDERPYMSEESRLVFLQQMEETFYDKEKKGIKAELKQNFPLWIKNYNFAKGRSELEYGNVFYNPATGEVYGAEDYRIEVRGINHYLIDGKEEINIDKDIGKEYLYDRIFNYFG